VLTDLPLLVVTDVTQLLLAPRRLMAALRRYNILQLFGCLYIKLTYKYVWLNNFSETLRFTNRNPSIRTIQHAEDTNALIRSGNRSCCIYLLLPEDDR
jgi:hypothetical protein